MEPFVTDTSTTELCRVRPRDLTEIASSLFDTMLGLPFETECPTGCSDSGRQFEAQINIEGCWKAAIHVRAPEEVARRITCVMFELKPEDLTEDDVRDALGECANVIGGSIKGVIDSDCDLSLPNVDIAPTGQRQCNQFSTFQCCGLPMCIAVVEHDYSCSPVSE